MVTDWDREARQSAQAIDEILPGATPKPCNQSKQHSKARYISSGSDPGPSREERRLVTVVPDGMWVIEVGRPFQVRHAHESAPVEYRSDDRALGT